MNSQRRVLAIERIDVPGAWQLPQGGLDATEEPLDAAYREVREETSIPRSALTLLQQAAEPLVYELPSKARSDKTGRGQVLYWFLFRFDGHDAVVNVHHGGESRNWQWMTLKDLVDGAADFRRPMYQKLSAEFRNHF